MASDDGKESVEMISERGAAKQRVTDEQKDTDAQSVSDDCNNDAVEQRSSTNSEINHSQSNSVDDVQTLNEILLLAATYVDDALIGRTLPYRTDSDAIRQYRIYGNTFRQLGTIFLMWWILCLAIFEDPAVAGAGLPNWATMLMELLCLGGFTVRMWRLFQFVPRDAFLHDPKNIVVALTIMITLLDMLVYTAMINSNAKDDAIRVSRILRPLFLVNMNESRQIRRAFRNIRNTIPDIFSVLVLFFFSIALFSLMAFKLFEKRQLTYLTGDPYFRNYWDSYWDLYVLVTTANSPDAMIPAYYESGWYSLFFIAYIIINTYIFMNLFLAVIYNSYKTHLENEIRNAVNEKQSKLDKAFDLLKNDVVDGKPCVTMERWNALIQNLTSSVSREKSNLLWSVLRNSQDVLTRKNFANVADAMNVRLVVDASDKNIFSTNFPRCFYSSASQLLIKTVNSSIFVWVFDILIIANAVCIALDLELTEAFFLPVFMIEIALRIYAVGPREYFSRDRLWNWFDFMIIMAAFIATVIEASLKELDTFPREALDILLVLRCLRLVKIVGNIERFRIVVVTMVNITPSLLTYGGVLVVVFYSFAIIGMEAFAGKIPEHYVHRNNCEIRELAGSEFERMGYCSMNFNDIIKSFITLFVLMVVNQWHVITQGYVLLTSKAARLFFIAFHLTVVILILNIIVAFVLEVFILEYTIKNNEMEDLIEKKISDSQKTANSGIDAPNFPDESNERSETSQNGITRINLEQDDNRSENDPITGTTYKLRVNKGHKNIEVLLQRMFYVSMKSEERNEVQDITVENVTQSSSGL